MVEILLCFQTRCNDQSRMRNVPFVEAKHITDTVRKVGSGNKGYVRLHQDTRHCACASPDDNPKHCDDPKIVCLDLDCSGFHLILVTPRLR